MPSLVKELISSELEAAFTGVEGFVMVSFGGLTVEETEGLRGGVAAAGANFKMVHNKIARRVLAGQGYEFPEGTFAGNTGIAYGDAEAVIGAAKVFTETEVRKAGKVKVKAGMLEDNVLSASDAVQLADVPDRDTLRSMMLSTINGPARALVATINAVPGGLARVIQAHADQDGGEE
jgi:large subunit ribosomal protein L10